MSGLRRTRPTSPRLVDSEILPLSEGRPVQEPMLSAHPQQLWLLPVDQAPSSSRAVWLYQAGHIPPNIASIMGQQELDALLRVLNREVVEAGIHMDAVLHTPKIDLEEGSSSLCMSALSCCCFFSVIFAVAFSVIGAPPVLTGILSGLACESVVMIVGRQYWREKPWLRPLLMAVLGFVGMPLLLIGVIPRDMERSQRELMIGAGVTLMACGFLLSVPMFVFVVASSAFTSQKAQAVRLRCHMTEEDPLSGLGPALLDTPATVMPREDKEPGKYFRQEHRREALCAGHYSPSEAAIHANNRVLLAAHYVMHKAMAIHPELRWTKGEATCMVRLPDDSLSQLRAPIIRVSEGHDSLAAEHIASALRRKRVLLRGVPFAAFVHHASQPDPETGETLVDDEMMHTRRQAFLALHGMEGMGHSPSEALPPMTGAVEEVVRRHQQPMSSAVASHAQAQPQAEGRGGGGYGGATSQFSPLASGADHAAKKKAAEDVGGGGGGAGGPSVV